MESGNIGYAIEAGTDGAVARKTGLQVTGIWRWADLLLGLLIMGFAPINHHTAEVTLNSASRLKNDDPGSAFEYAPNIHFVSYIWHSIGRAEHGRSLNEAPSSFSKSFLSQSKMSTSIPAR